MAQLVSTDRFHVTAETSALQGRIRCLPVKTLWLFGHGLAGITGVLLYPQLDALLVFLGTTAVTICAGHSVGMHRLLIHRSFETPRLVEYTLVWLGTLVSMAGPIGMIRTHDLRDWHQRQTECPPHPAHQAAFFRDAWWQLCCEFRLDHSPEFVLEDRVKQDRTYHFIEKTWMWQQLPLALLLYAFGGWAWVLWGCSLRIFVSLVGHWLVGHFSHRQGHQGWRISGLPVQGYNIRGISLLTFGENWHGNHHAFPAFRQAGGRTRTTRSGLLFHLGFAETGSGVEHQNSELGTGAQRLAAGLERCSDRELNVHLAPLWMLKPQPLFARNQGRSPPGRARPPPGRARLQRHQQNLGGRG